MTAPLISDATLAKIVRAVHAPPAQLSWHDGGELVFLVTHDRLAYALDQAKHRDPKNAELIAALEEANEEAARTHDEREIRDTSADHTRLADAVTERVSASLAGSGVEVERIADGFRLTEARPVFSTWFGKVDVSQVQAEVAPLLRAALASVDEAAKLRAERDAIKATCDEHEARVDRARDQYDALRARCTCGAAK